MFSILEHSCLKISKCAYLRAGLMKQYETELQRTVGKQLLVWEGDWVYRTVPCCSGNRTIYEWTVRKKKVPQDIKVSRGALRFFPQMPWDLRSPSRKHGLLQGNSHALRGAAISPSRSHLEKWKHRSGPSWWILYLDFPWIAGVEKLIHPSGLVFIFTPLDLSSWQITFLHDTSKQNTSLQIKVIKHEPLSILY